MGPGVDEESVCGAMLETGKADVHCQRIVCCISYWQDTLLSHTCIAFSSIDRGIILAMILLRSPASASLLRPLLAL